MTTDDLLRAQVEYYRRRADEYDATAYGDVAAARARIAAIVERMRPTGSVCEIACGTGLWTEALAATADTVIAVDTAPQALAIARGRVPSDTVRFDEADVFGWTTSRRFDVIFFAAWLSHVPSERFDEFWRWLGEHLADGGRVLFVDEHVDEQAKESYLADNAEIAVRALADGSTHRIVKNFVDPDELVARLRPLGWDCHVRREGADWVQGEARRIRP